MFSILHISYGNCELIVSLDQVIFFFAQGLSCAPLEASKNLTSSVAKSPLVNGGTGIVAASAQLVRFFFFFYSSSKWEHAEK